MPLGDFNRDRTLIDKLQSVTLTNPDQAQATTATALKRAGNYSEFGEGGFVSAGHETRWHVFKADLGAFVPRRDGTLVEASGAEWFITRVDLATFQERYVLTCTLQPGVGVQ